MGPSGVAMERVQVAMPGVAEAAVVMIPPWDG
jgi:acyl-coenzyme A synthetase/AMP-(fatty) acid ligase